MTKTPFLCSLSAMIKGLPLLPVITGAGWFVSITLKGSGHCRQESGKPVWESTRSLLQAH